MRPFYGRRKHTIQCAECMVRSCSREGRQLLIIFQIFVFNTINLIRTVTDIISHPNLDRNHNWTFRFETQSKVWRSFNLSFQQKTRAGTEFILLPGFSKESIGKICILNWFIHSALTTWVEQSLWKVKVRKHIGFNFKFAASTLQNISGERKRLRN